VQTIAHGIDLVRCDRIERIWQDHGQRFLERVYTPAEREYCLVGKLAIVRLSGRFAAKEAVLKVLGTGLRGGVVWTDIEVLPDPLGKPLVILHGVAAKLAEAAGIRRILISITHAGEYAMASAIGCG
jgi:holo-[acyl-carrier protein] synthase